MTIFKNNRNAFFFSALVTIFALIPILHAQSSQNCTLVGHWAHGPCNAITAEDNIFYFDDGGYLHIMDFSDNENPVELGRVDVTSVIVDIQGQEIKTLVKGFEASGTKTVKWDGLNNNGQQAGSGIYFYKIEAGSFSSSKKMLLVR